MNIIEQHINEIAALCKKHNVNTLYIFGSFAKGKATDKSDVDLLVTFGEVDLYSYADNYYDLIESLEKLLGRKVDLISEKAIENPYLIKSINRNRMKIYDRRDNKIAA